MYLDYQPRFCAKYNISIWSDCFSDLGNLREGMCFATAAKNNKRQDEDHNLGSAIQGRRHNVIVLDEEHGVMLSEIPLRNKTQQEIHENC